MVKSNPSKSLFEISPLDISLFNNRFQDANSLNWRMEGKNEK